MGKKGRPVTAEQNDDLSEDSCAEFFENVRSSVANSNVLAQGSSDEDSLLDYRDGILASSSDDDDEQFQEEDGLDLEKLLEEDDDAISKAEDDENEVDWGDRRENFYHKTQGEWDTKEQEDIELEESEALIQQKSLLSALDNDFAFVVKKKKTAKEDGDMEPVSQLPEMAPILEDLKSKCALLETKLAPFLALPRDSVSEVLRNAVQRLYTFYSFYCSVVCLFLVMRSKQPGSYHPIVRLLLNLRKTDQQMEEKVNRVLHLMSNQKACVLAKKSEEFIEHESETKGDGKRVVDNEILKNKPQQKQKRRRRNKPKTPRTCLKRKFEKALIKRNSQVPHERSKDKPYSGEPTGIKANIKRSIKLK